MQRGVGALAAGGRRVHALRVEPGLEVAGRDERVRGRQVAGEPREDAAALEDELRGQRPVAVERAVAATALDDLERHLVPLVGVRCELQGGIAAELMQRGAKLAKAHEKAVRRARA